MKIGRRGTLLTFPRCAGMDRERSRHGTGQTDQAGHASDYVLCRQRLRCRSSFTGGPRGPASQWHRREQAPCDVIGHSARPAFDSAARRAEPVVRPGRNGSAAESAVTEARRQVRRAEPIDCPACNSQRDRRAGGLHSRCASTCAMAWRGAGRSSCSGRCPAVTSRRCQQPAQATNRSAPGFPGSATLFGGSNLLEDPRSGARLTLGSWLDQTRSIGVEASGFWLSQQRNNFLDGSISGSRVVASSPFIDPTTSIPASILISYPGVAAGTTDNVMTGRSIWGAEALLRPLLSSGPGWRLDGLIGYRYRGFSESLEHYRHDFALWRAGNANCPQ